MISGYPQLRAIGTKHGPLGSASGTGIQGDASHLSATSRFRIDMPAYDVYLKFIEYPNFRISLNSAGEIPGANPIMVKAGWEPDGAGAVTAIPFQGARTAGILSGGRLRCDEQSILVPGGSKPWARQFVSVRVAGWTWPVGRIAHNTALGESENTFGTGAGTDQVDAIGTFGNQTNVYAYGPCGIYGIPANGLRQKAVALFGDSLATFSGGDGSPDYGDANGYAGYLERAINDDIATITATRASSRLQWVAAGFAGQLACIAPYVTSAVIQLGRNDVSASRTLVNMQTDFTTIATALQAYGVNVFATTITPKPSTTADSGLDGGSSINAGEEAVRVPYNAWLMTLPVGIKGCFDVATAVGDPARVGYFRPNNPAISTDLTHLTATGIALAQAVVNTSTLR